MAAAVCRRDGGLIVRMCTVLFEAIFLFHKHLLHVSLSGAGKRTAVFRSECSVKYPRPAYALQPPSCVTNTVKKKCKVTPYEVSANNIKIKTQYKKCRLN